MVPFFSPPLIYLRNYPLIIYPRVTSPYIKNMMYGNRCIVGKPIHWAPLPRKPCVADLLQTYAATKRQGGVHGQAWRDFAGCLTSYFDAALPRLRLYGAEHLVRLIIKLPKLLAQTN